MITGTGIDIVHVPRISRLMDEHGERFMKKILSDDEISRMPGANREHYTAGRFAAKEALVKAAGSSFSFGEVSILNDPSGKPYFSGRILEGIAPDARIHLSISHDTDYATAFVIVEKL